MRIHFILTISIVVTLSHCEKIITVGEPLYLTPYIENGDIETAKKLALVNLKDAENITSYAGLFTVNKTYDSVLFHWYFVSENDPENAPVLLWLNGGPGASSLLGCLQENGPFEVTSDLNIKFREFYWTKNHHVVYIESPVHTGYSTTATEDGMAKSLEEVSENLHKALLQFFEMFPNLKTHDFFITGESFAGKWIPSLGHQILSKKQIKNFKGVAIGNGITDSIQGFGIGDYLYQQGFIDDEQLVLFHEKEKECENALQNVPHGAKNESELLVCRQIIDPYNNKTVFANTTGYTHNYNLLISRPLESNANRETYLQLPETRRALHVGNLTRWADQANVQKHLGISMIQSEKPHIEEMLNNNYQVLIYNGQLDVQVPYITTVNYIKKLNFTHSKDYKKASRKIWLLDDQVAGYIKKAGSLTEVMVVGSGHMVPTDQPKRAFEMITNFTRYRLD
ncbi:venom serine carboxypeptidase-like [Chrysoperla carnea]|uniref:venom serine carboxypeptidase-like n=1 Tax=Chrysoperla carnea TaxID=189513 RepID=UPI001D099BDF|nr:venom serine carboxypeptidase-like [Chrysoperla carnea]